MSNNEAVESATDAENADRSPLLPSNQKNTLLRTSLAWLGLIIFGLFAYTLSYLTEPPFPFSQNKENQSSCCSQESQSFNTPTGSENSETKRKSNARQEKNEDSQKVRSGDLAAQRGMWRATNVMAIVAFFQGVATFAGIYLLYDTLRATRKTLGIADETLNETRQATVAARNSTGVNIEACRAHVFIDLEVVGANGREALNGVEARPNTAFYAKANIRNYGSTPALRVKVQTKTSFVDSTENFVAEYLHEAPSIPVNRTEIAVCKPEFNEPFLFGTNWESVERMIGDTYQGEPMPAKKIVIHTCFEFDDIFGGHHGPYWTGSKIFFTSKNPPFREWLVGDRYHDREMLIGKIKSIESRNFFLVDISEKKA